MRKSQITNCLTAEDWESYLHPLAAENANWQTHLECCSACRGTLNELAGTPIWWQDAQELLAIQGDEPAIAQLHSSVNQSVCAMAAENSVGDTHDPLSEFEIRQLQQMLSPASHPELLGRIGRYELEQLIGRGGMGLVFRARDIELHRVVAVKTLAVHLIPIAAARERFIREARASAALVHPHIVPVHDVITDGEAPALVMQYIAGPSLEAWLATHGSISWENVLQLAIQLSDALAAAHAHGLVHRDVKPGNVLLEADGSRALLTDFGLVRTLDVATLTHSGMLAGTPDYMSPEQARGEAVDHCSDLFSLGSMLYAMLTGSPPFRAHDAMAIMNRICHQPHRRLAETHTHIPIEICRMVDRLLAKEPKRRFASAKELCLHLQTLAQSPLHLNSSRLSRTAATSLILVAVASIGIALLTTVYWKSVQNDVVDSPASTASHLSSATITSDGLTELRALDQSLGELSNRVRDLERELQVPPVVTTINRKSTPFEQQLQGLTNSMRRLERELKIESRSSNLPLQPD